MGFSFVGNAAVTGGTGFLGRALLRLLVPQADEVRVLVRRSEDEQTMRSLGVVPVRGDVTVPGGCDGLVRDGDVVFHAAARVDMAGSWREFADTTVEGTRRLLETALAARIERFVYVSSGGVYSPAHARGGASADRTPAIPARNNYYALTKLAAENLVREECDRAGCRWSIIRLGFLYGPGNRPFLNHFVPLLKSKRLYVIGNGRNRIASLYVDDAARAVLLAGTHPDAEGKIYDVASDELVTQQDFLDATADALELPRPTQHVSTAVAHGAAAFAELWARLRGRQPPFTRAMVGLMSYDQKLDADRICEELDWRPEVRLREGMQRLHAWYLEQRGNDTDRA